MLVIKRVMKRAKNQLPLFDSSQTRLFELVDILFNSPYIWFNKLCAVVVLPELISDKVLFTRFFDFDMELSSWKRVSSLMLVLLPRLIYDTFCASILSMETKFTEKTKVVTNAINDNDKILSLFLYINVMNSPCINYKGFVIVVSFS